MNRAWRCPARSKDGHQCHHKAGHQSVKDVKYPQHSAFGKLWA